MPKIKKFTGLNNVLPAERAGQGDLQTADNVLVTDTGAIKRRSAGIKYRALGDAEAATRFGLRAVVVIDGVINIDTGSSVTAKPRTWDSNTIDSGVYAGFCEVNGSLYYSDGTVSGKIDKNLTHLPWGLNAPSLVSNTVSGSGTFQAGTYLVSACYYLTDGQEGPMCATQTRTITSVGQEIEVSIGASTHPSLDGIRVYISRTNGQSGTNGELLVQHADVSSEQSFSFRIQGPPTYGAKGGRTLNMAPMPACQWPAFYRGRMYAMYQNDSTLESFIIYSEPGKYELIQLDKNYIPLGGNVTNKGLIPVENGIWVLTSKEAFFLAGKTPEQGGGFEKRSVINGACLSAFTITDSEKLGVRGLASGKVALWVSSDGVYAGDGNGQYVNITDGKWSTSSSPGIGGCIYDVDGEASFVFGVYGNGYAMNLKTGAVTTFLPSVFAGWFVYVNSKLYLSVDGAGWYRLDGATDYEGEAGSAVISSTITKNGIDFDSNYVKKITDLFMHMRSDGNLSVTATSETGTGTVTLIDGIDTMHGSKADLPRGVKGRNLSLSVSNVEGSDFEINEMDIEVDISRGRRARQTGG